MSDVGQPIPRRALTPNPQSSAVVYNSGMPSIDGAKHIGDLIADRNIILEGFDAISQRGFTQVPNYVLKEFDISPDGLSPPKPAARLDRQILRIKTRNICAYGSANSANIRILIE